MRVDLGISLALPIRWPEFHMDLELNGRIALVMGGSKGIGRAIATSLAQEGVSVTIASRTEKNLLAAQQDIFNVTGRKVDIHVSDNAIPGMAAETVNAVIRNAGRIDILINNSGGPPPGRLQDVSADMWMSAYTTQLHAVVSATRVALPPMQAAGWGRVISIATILAMEPTADMMLSATFRAAVCAFTKSVSMQVVGSGVTANVICPSAVLTDRAREFANRTALESGMSIDAALLDAAASLPMKRFADDQEIGGFAAYLCSRQAAYITGRALPFDGGVLRSYF